MLDQEANILFILGEHPFNEIGSLTFDADGAIRVGAAPSDRTRTLPCIGPFEEANNYYRTWANTYVNLIADDQMFSLYTMDAYLMFKFLSEKVNTGHWFDEWRALNSGLLFLKHVNDKGGHILVDDNFGITSVIYWNFARTIHGHEAFGPSLVSANTSNLFAGKPGLSEEDRLFLGRELKLRGTPHCYFESDKMRRLLFGLEMGLGLTRDEAVDVFQGLVATFEGAMPDFQGWQQACLTKWSTDPRLVALRQAS